MDGLDDGVTKLEFVWVVEVFLADVGSERVVSLGGGVPDADEVG